jgi:hypothetical protein
MDAMVTHQEEVDQVLASLLRPLVDQDLAVVFYDMTTIRAEGLSQQDDDLRKFGMSKEGLVARQVMLGVVQTADGLPLYHEVFDGNTAEVTTIKPIIEKIVQRFPVKRVIAVADRGLLSIAPSRHACIHSGGAGTALWRFRRFAGAFPGNAVRRCETGSVGRDGMEQIAADHRA